MTIPPFEPPSGSQPPSDRYRAPLEIDEAALAASLRALPACAPSSELDARILAMAQSALKKEDQQPSRTASPSRRGGRKSTLLWWMGTAAGAVMAAGIGWQLGGFGDPGSPARRPHGAAEARPAAKASDELEILMIPRSASDATPAPPAAGAPRSAPVPAAEPAASAERESRRRELSASDSSEPPSSPSELAPAAPDRAVVARPSPAPAAAAAAAPAAANADGERAQPLLERIEVTGSRLQRGVEFPPVAQDFRLAPEDWLQRVRERRDSGDLDSARRSVREFVRAHPQRVLPKDLRLLLNEAQ